MIQTSTAGTRILIVDDEPDSLLAFSALLDGIADEIVTASSGEKALELVDEGEFAVILLDVLLPGLDGFETARGIKERQSTGSTPIIFITGVDKDGVDAGLGYAAGGVDFLMKPVDPDALKTKVKALVDSYRIERLLKDQLDAVRAEKAKLEVGLDERSRLLERLREERDRYETLLAELSELGEGVVVTDAGRLLYANDAYCKMTGYGYEELEALPTLLELADPAERPALVERLSRRLAGGEVEDRYQAGLIRKDGRRVETDVAVRLLKTAHGPRIISVVRDITEVRQREDEQRVLDEMKADFISMVAHDLRSPAAVIVGLAQTLDQQWDSLSEEQRRLLVERIAHRGRSLSRIASQAVEVARLERGRPLSLQLEEFDIAELIHRALDEILGERANRVEVVTPADLAFAIGDRQSTWHVLANLVSNAVRFTGENGRIAITATSDERWVTVTVSDDGPGVSPEDEERIFEKFFSGRRATGGGTGLGLYVARGLVEAQEGRLWLDTSSTKGATFMFTLPVAPRPNL